MTTTPPPPPPPLRRGQSVRQNPRASGCRSACLSAASVFRAAVSRRPLSCRRPKRRRGGGTIYCSPRPVLIHNNWPAACSEPCTERRCAPQIARHLCPTACQWNGLAAQARQECRRPGAAAARRGATVRRRQSTLCGDSRRPHRSRLTNRVGPGGGRRQDSDGAEVG